MASAEIKSSIHTSTINEFAMTDILDLFSKLKYRTTQQLE
jgi:hypothetical protein